MMRILNYRLVLLTLLLVSHNYLQTSIASTQNIEITDGVRTVHNEKSKWGDEPKVELKFVRQIGEFDALDDNYLFGRIYDVENDADGNIYIVDKPNFRIQKFDPEGRFLKTFGSGVKGKGPAEFEFAEALAFDSDGLLYVSDHNKRKILVLDQDGKEIKRFGVRNTVIGNFLINTSDHILIKADGNYTYEERRELSKGKQFTPEERRMQDYTPRLIRTFDTAGLLLFEYGQKKEYEDREMFNNMNDYGNRFFYALDKGDNIYTSFEVQNRIEKYSKDGKLLLKIDRKTDFKETNERKLEQGPPGGIPSPKYNFFSFGIGVDHKERIWILGVNKQKKVWNDRIGMHLEIYNPTGILLGILPIPKDIYFPKLRVFGNQVFLIDNHDELAVFIYEIVEK